jgi:hypothetical protein
MRLFSSLRSLLRRDKPTLTAEEAIAYVKEIEAKWGQRDEIVAYSFVRQLDSDWVCEVHTLDNSGRGCWQVWREPEGYIYGEC